MEKAESPVDAKIAGLVDACVDNRTSIDDLRKLVEKDYNVTAELMVRQENDRTDIANLYAALEASHAMNDDLHRDLAACKIVAGCAGLMAFCGIVLVVM